MTIDMTIEKDRFANDLKLTNIKDILITAISISQSYFLRLIELSQDLSGNFYQHRKNQDKEKCSTKVR